MGYFLGAVLMVAGGLAEAFLGVKAEGQSLESIAQPLTADESGGSTDSGADGAGEGSGRGPKEPQPSTV